MKSQQKFLLGLIIGYVGYMAYKKLKTTQTVIVDTFQDPTMPNYVGNIAGRIF